ncbi:hypothetical protein [Tunturiibacter lichenicola]|uniref:hypothetical protein n=1 Tax=Tunturiibacter lichenicola TaxID=2051959 RepID=UPI0021B1ED64|nr:hypothetical protein [Edaphobacter lichenicola]
MRRPYANSDGDSGINNYEILGSAIIIEFVNAKYRYVYDSTKPGPEHVRTMMTLAKQGRGLATYINQHVGSSYARRVPL